MHIAHILPLVNVADKSFNTMRQRYEMHLAHLVLKYPSVYKDIGHKADVYTILDNSFVELGCKSMTLEDTLKAATLLGASQIILPDDLDGEISFNKSYRAYNSRMLRGFPYDLMCVVHAKTWEEAIQLVHQIEKSMPRVKTLGLPRPIAGLAPLNKGRVLLSSYIKATTNLNVHLLGSSLGLSEFVGCDVSSIRSLDTSWFMSKYYMDTLRKERVTLIDRPFGYTVDLETAEAVNRDHARAVMTHLEIFMRKWSLGYDYNN